MFNSMCFHWFPHCALLLGGNWLPPLVLFQVLVIRKRERVVDWSVTRDEEGKAHQILWPGSNGNISELFLAYPIGDSSFHYRRSEQEAPALVITWSMAHHLSSHQSHLGPQGGVSGSLQERLIRESIYSQSFWDDSADQLHLGITGSAERVDVPWG